MRQLAVIIAAVLLLPLFSYRTPAQSGEDLFQQALQKERSLGDIEGAIALYEEIASRYAEVQRPLVARALLQMGRSYEKLGARQEAEALRAYERIIYDYSDQSSEVEQAQLRLAVLNPMEPESTDTRDRTGMTIRKVVSRDLYGLPSPDGRYFSDVNWDRGNLALFDSKSGDYRDLTDDGFWAKPAQFADLSLWSPDSKQIAYSWFIEDPFTSQIRIVNLDGDGPRILASGPREAVPGAMAWSRDGKSILAVVGGMHPDHSNSRIVWIDVESGAITTVMPLAGDRCTGRIALSPDSRFIAYQVYQDASGADGPRDLRIYSIDGSTELPLIEHPSDDHSPHWTPTGKGVVFTSERSGKIGLWYVAVTDGSAAGEPKLIHEIGEFYDYGMTNDGTYYYGAMRSSVNLFAAALDADEAELIIETNPSSRRFEGTNFAPGWSPDGSQMAYLSRRESGDVIVIRDEISGAEKDIKPGLYWWHHSPAWDWSPDGSAIFVNALEGTTNGPTAQYRIDIESGNATKVADGEFRGTVYAPDGQFMYHLGRGDSVKTNILRRDLDTGTEIQIGSDEKYICSMSLSPSGTQLAYYHCDTETADYQELKVFSLESGGTKVLWKESEELSIPTESGITWMPEGEGLLFVAQDTTGAQQFYLLDTDNGVARAIGVPLGGGSQIGRIDVHPDGKTLVFGQGVISREVWAIENIRFDN